jgi:hypothetical protein
MSQRLSGTMAIAFKTLQDKTLFLSNEHAIAKKGKLLYDRLSSESWISVK